MNLLHIKYAVEVAEAGSINQAAEKLLTGQPNLSRAIKELESSVGITIFERSAKGMRLTSDGEIFMNYAKNILRQVDAIEETFCKGVVNCKRFSLSAPRADYIAEAVVRFSNLLRRESDVEVHYCETNAYRAIKNILQEDYRLGIIRYVEEQDKYYKSLLEEKGLNYEMIAEFSHVLLMNIQAPLAEKKQIKAHDLADYIEITSPDSFVPSAATETKKEHVPPMARRRIFMHDRAGRLELLAENPHAFMWSSAVPQAQLARFGLVQKPCVDCQKNYKDVLIYKKDYHFTELDTQFIAELCKVRRSTFQS